MPTQKKKITQLQRKKLNPGLIKWLEKHGQPSRRKKIIRGEGVKDIISNAYKGLKRGYDYLQDKKYVGKYINPIIQAIPSTDPYSIAGKTISQKLSDLGFGNGRKKQRKNILSERPYPKQKFKF